MKFKLIAAAIVAAALSLGGGASIAAADTPTYTLTAWQLGAGSTPASPWVTAQTKVAEVTVTDETLTQLDSSPLLTCGNSYQVDLYTQPTVGTTLTGPSTPNAEHFPNDNAPHWKYITEPACPLPDYVYPDATSTCDSFTLGALPTADAKYPLIPNDPNGARYTAGVVYPLTPGQTVTVSAHVLASDTVYKPSSHDYTFTGTACPTSTPTPTPTPTVPPKASTCGAGTVLACTGDTVNWGGWVLGGGLGLTGFGLVLLRRKFSAG